MQAGSGPDIILYVNFSVGSLANLSDLVPLDNLGLDDQYLTQNYDPLGEELVKWQGETWGLPVVEDSLFLIYNQQTINRSDLPDNPMALDDLLARAKAYSEKNPGKYLVCNQVFNATPNVNFAVPVFYAFSNGQALIDDTGKVSINTPEMIAAAKWLVEFAKYAPQNVDFSACQKMFQDGTAAAVWETGVDISALDPSGSHYGVVPMGRPEVGALLFSITRNALEHGNSQQALDLIQFLSNAENSQKMAASFNQVPANLAARSTMNASSSPEFANLMIGVNLGVPISTAVFNYAGITPISNAFRDIFSGAKTPEQALEEAQSATETEVAKWK